MKVNQTTRHRTWFKLISVFLLMFLGWKSQAQITTPGCTNTFSYCTADTVKLQPQDMVTYTNFQWYALGAPDVLITAGNAATYNVDPTRLTNNAIYVTASGGTYILKAEYAIPSGCATKNDTITINFLPTPDLVTSADTICAAAGQSADLTLLVTDGNGTAGPAPVWYPTLADAEDETNALVSTTVSPGVTTKYYVRKNTTADDAEGFPCYDIDSVIVDVRCLNLGNYISYDTNNNGLVDMGEQPIAGVTVELFYDENGNGIIDPSEQTPYATDVTDGSGLYLFENLPEGDYFVGVPASEFGGGGTLQYLYSSGTTMGGTGTTSEASADDVDTNPSYLDDNGMTVKTGFYAGGVMTPSSLTLSYQAEPTSETPDNSSISDADDNLTVGFGFYGMSIGSTIFADVNNNATQDVGEGGIPNVTVHLYAADGTTIIATTTTDSNGNFFFPGLPQGDYIVGVDTADPELDGQHSSDDIATSANPENNVDGDDNGTTLVGAIIKSGTITLTPGAEPGTPVPGSTNPLSPSTNYNSTIDFAFVPDCPTITNPTGAQTICATDSGTNLTADASSTAGNIRFVRYTSAQTGNAMYTGGTVIANSVAPVAGTATYTFNTADFPNTGNTVITYYVYAIMATPSPDPTCRPYQEIQVVVNPKPTAAAGVSLTECENGLGSGEADFTLTDADADVLNGQTGMTVTYHATQADADNDVNALISPYSAVPSNIYVRVENAYGCYATAQVALNVNARPDFTLSLPTTCPGDEPTLMISNLTNGDAIMSLMDLNGGGFEPYQASYVFTTADGLLLDANNTVTVRNENGCETAKTEYVDPVTPLVCPPVNVTVKRAGE